MKQKNNLITISERAKRNEKDERSESRKAVAIGLFKSVFGILPDSYWKDEYLEHDDLVFYVNHKSDESLSVAKRCVYCDLVYGVDGVVEKASDLVDVVKTLDKSIKKHTRKAHKTGVVSKSDLWGMTCAIKDINEKLDRCNKIFLDMFPDENKFLSKIQERKSYVDYGDELHFQGIFVGLIWHINGIVHMLERVQEERNFMLRQGIKDGR